jgi:hypothetical protein
MNADHAIVEETQSMLASKTRNVTSTEAVLTAHRMKLFDWMETFPANNATEEYAQRTRCFRLMENANHAELAKSLTHNLDNATDPIVWLDQHFK